MKLVSTQPDKNTWTILTFGPTFQIEEERDNEPQARAWFNYRAEISDVGETVELLLNGFSVDVYHCNE